MRDKFDLFLIVAMYDSIKSDKERNKKAMLNNRLFLFIRLDAKINKDKIVHKKPIIK